MTKAKRGQVWRESDKRVKGRTVRIEATLFGEDGERYAIAFCSATGRTTRIRLDRFDGKQFVLVERYDG